MNGQMQRIGRGGHIAGYDVLITADRIVVSRDAGAGAGETWTHKVPNYETAIGELADRPGFRLGWGRFPDDAEVLFFYDKDDGNFGYALNVTYGEGEWGYAPF